MSEDMNPCVQVIRESSDVEDNRAWRSSISIRPQELAGEVQDVSTTVMAVPMETILPPTQVA